jgi:hypothetical protein
VVLPAELNEPAEYPNDEEPAAKPDDEERPDADEPPEYPVEEELDDDDDEEPAPPPPLLSTPMVHIHTITMRIMAAIRLNHAHTIVPGKLFCKEIPGRWWFLFFWGLSLALGWNWEESVDTERGERVEEGAKYG